MGLNAFTSVHWRDVPITVLRARSDLSRDSSDRDQSEYGGPSAG